MISMEFNEMKKIWDTQNNEAIYGINEKALHQLILSKQKKGYHITNISELLMIIVNTISGCFVLAVNLIKPEGNIFLFVLAAWMLVTALYFLVSRVRRMKGNQQFDRTMHGDLEHAISVATYQVRLSILGRWNILPIGILTLLALSGSGKSLWLAAGILVFFIVANYAAGWEHNIYKSRKRELELLKNKLENVK